MIYSCLDNCCEIRIERYIPVFHHKHDNRRRYKAGVFICDPTTKRILLVQSRGHLWGPPKGTMNDNETIEECAIREVKEETGLDVDPRNFTECVSIKNRATYYYMEMSQCPVEVQNHIPGNDANGIGWIKIDCLDKLIKSDNLSINQHCRHIIQKFLNRDL